MNIARAKQNQPPKLHYLDLDSLKCQCEQAHTDQEGLFLMCLKYGQGWRLETWEAELT